VIQDAGWNGGQHDDAAVVSFPTVVARDFRSAIASSDEGGLRERSVESEVGRNGFGRPRRLRQTVATPAVIEPPASLSPSDGNIEILRSVVQPLVLTILDVGHDLAPDGDGLALIFEALAQLSEVLISRVTGLRYGGVLAAIPSATILQHRLDRWAIEMRSHRVAADFPMFTLHVCALQNSDEFCKRHYIVQANAQRR
jgi:hypothetical protein